MLRFAFSWSVIVCLVFASYGHAATAQKEEKVEIGKAAPKFTLVDAKNKKVSLEEFQKKEQRVVLVFSRAHW